MGNMVSKDPDNCPSVKIFADKGLNLGGENLLCLL